MKFPDDIQQADELLDKAGTLIGSRLGGGERPKDATAVLHLARAAVKVERARLALRKAAGNAYGGKPSLPALTASLAGARRTGGSRRPSEQP